MLGFPIDMISLLRCTHDDSELVLEPDYRQSADMRNAIESGNLRCQHCQSIFHIDRGVLNLLDHSRMDEESLHEQKSRDANGFTVDPLVTNLDHANNEMEMISTLKSLPVVPASLILELGCGEGRYTLPLASSAKVLAVDFSIEMLGILRNRLPASARVGLVMADISSLKVSASQFDYVLSTLTSNLPSSGHRENLYALARHALRQSGRFVFSTHHHGFRQILSQVEKSGRYRPGGIYRYNFRVRECVEEASPFFKLVHARPIQIHLPFARSLKLPIVRLSRLLERVPLLNKFGMLVLCVAEHPRKVARRVTKSGASIGAM